MRCAPLLFYGLLTAGGHLSSIRMRMAPNQRMQYGLINERMASIVAAAASHRARAKTAFRMGDKATALRLLKLAKQCDAECAAEAATLSSDFALAAERASTGSNRIEQQLIEQATPIAASPDSNAAAEALKSFGVSRVDGVLDVSACAELKSHILKLREEAADPTSQRWAIWMGAADNRYVPGSRVKFAAALEEKLTTTRSDLLLPLEDAVVADALRTALSSLKAVLVDGSASLPAEFDGSGDGDHGDDCADGGEPAGEGAGGGCGLPETLQELELVECGALIAKPGAEHQALHAEYVSSSTACDLHSTRFQRPRAEHLERRPFTRFSCNHPGRSPESTPCALALLLACLPRSCAATAAEIS